MNDNRFPQSMMINLGPTFLNGAMSSQSRSDQLAWLSEINEHCEHIFTLNMPLELVDADRSFVRDDSARSSPLSLEFAITGDGEIHGETPDSYTYDILRAGGELEPGVDVLARLAFFADVDVSMLMSALQNHSEINAEWLNTNGQDLFDPQFTMNLDQKATTRARQLIGDNIERHEREHIRCLITPRTALWRELELYWRSVLICENPQYTWDNKAFLNRLSELYATPSRFTTELLAILEEDYTTAAPVVQQAVEQYVTTQRGAEGDLFRFITNREIDPNDLAELLQTPVGETYCDLWLAYIIDSLRSGVSLNEIDVDIFRDHVGAETDPYYRLSEDYQTRNEFIGFISDHCLGPVFELVRFRFDETVCRLERSWFSLNPDVSAATSILAVRRALYRRQFFAQFSANSGLSDILVDQEIAMEHIIRGTSLADENLFERAYPAPGQLTAHLEKARTAALEALLGQAATVEDLGAWLKPEHKPTTEC
jgi:hypothetical protein